MHGEDFVESDDFVGGDGEVVEADGGVDEDAGAGLLACLVDEVFNEDGQVFVVGSAGGAVVVELGADGLGEGVDGSVAGFKHALMVAGRGVVVGG